MFTKLTKVIKSPSKIVSALDAYFIAYVFFRKNPKKILVTGFDNSKKIIKTYNVLRNYNSYTKRQKLYKDKGKFESLLKSNSPSSVQSSLCKINDGWVIDETLSLPYLSEMVKTGESLFAEKESDKGVGRDNFYALMDAEQLKKHSVFYDFATSSEMIKIVSDYIGTVPVLTNMDLFRSTPIADYTTNGSAWFHLDRVDTFGVRVVIHFNDVTKDDGPFCFLPASVSAEAQKKTGYGKKGKQDILSDDEMYKAVDKNKLVEGTIKKGGILFVDSGRCFHYGSRTKDGVRKVCMLTYTSAARQNPYKLIKKENWHTYPFQSGWSELKELVLNEKYAI